MAWAPSSTEIRRADSASQAALREFFAGLSSRTRYLRFFAAIMPTPAMLRYLRGTGPASVDAVIATAGGDVIGHGMGVDRPGPGGEIMTDIGVVVADAWQGRGVGSALTRTVVSRAQSRGSAALTMDVLHGNSQVLGMISSHWPSARSTGSADGLEIHVPLPLPLRRPARRRTPAPLPRRRAHASRALLAARPGQPRAARGGNRRS
jgi:GNAT superfamily N-acetyltransferase